MKIMKVGTLWCLECLMMNPIWEAIAKEMPNLELKSFDADEDEELLKPYSIKDIPTFIFFSQDNQELFRVKGLQKKEKLLELIKENLDK
jgi:thiol-disulfide isomerase/thioredoxin